MREIGYTGAEEVIRSQAFNEASYGGCTLLPLALYQHYLSPSGCSMMESLAQKNCKRAQISKTGWGEGGDQCTRFVLKISKQKYLHAGSRIHSPFKKKNF